MSTRKTLTTAVTAVALVTGISLAWAQTEDQSPQTDTTAAAVAVPSEQTPADPNALPPADNTTATQVQQAQQADDPSRVLPPADTTAPMPSQTPAPAAQDNGSPAITPAVTPAAEPAYEPAPRADRN